MKGAVGRRGAARNGVGPASVSGLGWAGLHLALSSAGAAVLGLLFWVVTARLHDPQEVGAAATLISIAVLVATITDCGFGVSLIQFLSAVPGRERHWLVRSYAIAGGLAMVVAAVVMLVLSRTGSKVGFAGQSGPWFLTVVAGTVGWQILSLQDGALMGLTRTSWVLARSLAYQFAKIVLVVLLAGTTGAVAGTFIAWFAPAIAAAAIVNVRLFRSLPRLGRSEETNQRRPGFALSIGANYLGSLSSLAGMSLVPIIVTEAKGTRIGGFAAIPWTFFVGLQALTIAISLALTAEGGRRPADIRRLAVSATRQMCLFLFPAVAGVVLLAPQILSVYGPDYRTASTDLLRLLALASLPSLLFQVAVAVARSRGSRRTIIGLQAAAAAIGLTLTPFLLATNGIRGLGVAWLISQSLIGLVSAVLLARWLRPLRGRAPAGYPEVSAVHAFHGVLPEADLADATDNPEPAKNLATTEPDQSAVSLAATIVAIVVAILIWRGTRRWRRVSW